MNIQTADGEYKMPPMGLFGKRCKIPTGYSGRPFVYRILNSGVRSNAWTDIPIVANSVQKRHDQFDDVIFVVLDTLIDENSKIIRVALKDVEIMEN